jgi:hypothetical protein
MQTRCAMKAVLRSGCGLRKPALPAAVARRLYSGRRMLYNSSRP